MNLFTNSPLCIIKYALSNIIRCLFLSWWTKNLLSTAKKNKTKQKIDICSSNY